MKVSLIDFDNTGFPNLAATIFGGTAFYPNTLDLGKEMEHTCPDYKLYPNMDYSMGFITRGCIRKCPFCIVPQKEGSIYFSSRIEEFQRHNKVVLMDNNILACKKGVDELYKISKTDTKIDVNQGMDFRLVDNAITELLAKLKWIRFIRTACDSDSVFEDVKKSVELLGKKGVKPYRIFCYCLVKSKKDASRISELAKLGVDVFAMGFMDFNTGYKSKEVIDVCNWCNLKKIFAQCKNYEEYRNQKKRRHLCK